MKVFFVQMNLLSDQFIEFFLNSLLLFGRVSLIFLLTEHPPLELLDSDDQLASFPLEIQAPLRLLWFNFIEIWELQPQFIFDLGVLLLYLSLHCVQLLIQRLNLIFLINDLLLDFVYFTYWLLRTALFNGVTHQGQRVIEQSFVLFLAVLYFLLHFFILLLHLIILHIQVLQLAVRPLVLFIALLSHPFWSIRVLFYFQDLLKLFMLVPRKTLVFVSEADQNVVKRSQFVLVCCRIVFQYCFGLFPLLFEIQCLFLVKFFKIFLLDFFGQLVDIRLQCLGIKTLVHI